MKHLKIIYSKVPPYLKNKYAFTAMLLFGWMLVFDSNDLIYQVKMRMHLSDLRDKKDYFISQIEEVKQDRLQLFGSQASIEKFAREKYWMKKDNEEIFIIVEQ